MSVTKKLCNILPKDAFLTIYKSFVRQHLDYGDIVYNQSNNQKFLNKTEAAQYNTAFTVTNTMKGTSRAKLYKELEIQSLNFPQQLRRLCMFL